MPENKECFVISPIGPEDSEIRERADMMLNHVIESVMEEYGYDTIRADDIEEPGQITTQVLQHTVNSELVIADITNQNPNVFYELAIRHAAREPFIQVIEEGNEIPFDVHNQRTISIDIEDLNSVENAKGEIKRQIEAIESGEADITSPVSMAMDLQFWEESGDPQQQEMADVIEIVTDLKSDINRIGSQLEDKEQSTGLDQEDIVRLEDLLEKSEKMTDAIHDIQEIVNPSESKAVDDVQKWEMATDFIERSIRQIQREIDEILHKHY